MAEPTHTAQNCQQTKHSSAKARRSWFQAIARSPFFWAAVAGVIVVPLIRPLLRHVPEPPPVLGILPRFSLVDQTGRPFGSDQLKGQVYVTNFFFTSCQSICPRLIKAMRKLQDRFQQNKVPVRLLSISVDPETDTPPRLTAYAKKHGADLTRWTFLTGPEPELRALIVKGFSTHMGQRAVSSDNLVDISHAGLLVLVDGAGGIRGYYQPDQAGLDEIFHRSQHVLTAARSEGK